MPQEQIVAWLLGHVGSPWDSAGAGSFLICLPAASTTGNLPFCLQINYENRRLRGKDQQLSCHVASPPLNQATWDSLDFTVSGCTLASLGRQWASSLSMARLLHCWTCRLAALRTSSAVWAWKTPCTCIARSHHLRVSWDCLAVSMACDRSLMYSSACTYRTVQAFY